MINILWNLKNINDNFIIFSENAESIDKTLIEKYRPIMVTSENPTLLETNADYIVYTLTDTNLSLYLPAHYYDKFNAELNIIEQNALEVPIAEIVASSNKIIVCINL